MEPGTAFNNFIKKTQHCAICGKELSYIEAPNIDWNMRRPGVYIYWHKSCHREGKKQNA